MAKPRGLTPDPKVLQRESEVLKLRRAGHTWDTIAQIVGYADPSGPQQAYKRAANRIVHDDIEAIRQIEQDRLDIAQAAIWNKVTLGDIFAIQTLLKIMERRAKLLGLDSPVRQQVEVTTHDGDNIDAEVARLAAILATSSGSAPHPLDA